jgi:hypothetical protein
MRASLRLTLLCLRIAFDEQSPIEHLGEERVNFDKEGNRIPPTATPGCSSVESV